MNAWGAWGSGGGAVGEPPGDGGCGGADEKATKETPSDGDEAVEEPTGDVGRMEVRKHKSPCGEGSGVVRLRTSAKAEGWVISDATIVQPG